MLLVKICKFFIFLFIYSFSKQNAVSQIKNYKKPNLNEKNSSLHKILIWMKHIYSLKIEQTVNYVDIKDSIQNNFTDKTLGIWLKNSKTKFFEYWLVYDCNLIYMNFNKFYFNFFMSDITMLVE